ncbi:hypothetical protein PCASD_08003 [Puccinia coronata f. sp. avenae]|uniref:Uncharacterized protein n=1 Tax=Puccinia coronata f. sp. avenae TaxID=200324 RepID=A0A2N5UNW7_9BASI|nr:hypothetical protein PCASD_08003 [Puccinia coronata f. sp. avenae]
MIDSQGRCMVPSKQSHGLNIHARVGSFVVDCVTARLALSQFEPHPIIPTRPIPPPPSPSVDTSAVALAASHSHRVCIIPQSPGFFPNRVWIVSQSHGFLFTHGPFSRAISFFVFFHLFTEYHGGEGHQLNELPGSTSQQPNAIGRPNADPHEGGREEDPRRAAAAAAEARAQAAKSRGTKGGEIAKALSNQAADGGRVDQAIATGGQSANQKPLIWD